MDVEASPSTNALEVATTRTMMERVELNHGIVPRKLMADTIYGAAENLGFLVEEKQIEPHIPVMEKSKRKDGTFSSSDFRWDEEKDEYQCPAGKGVRHNNCNYKVPRSGITKANTKIYFARKADCDNCSLKQQCCPNTPSRKITRSVHEKARDLARVIVETDEYKNKSVHERKKVEMMFAHMKCHLGFDRLRLRGLDSANDEFLLVAAAQNLRRLAKLCAQPPPSTG